MSLGFGIVKKEEDWYVCSDINPFPERPNFPLPDKMHDDIFEVMKIVEEANEREFEISQAFNQRADDLTCKVMK